MRQKDQTIATLQERLVASQEHEQRQRGLLEVQLKNLIHLQFEVESLRGELGDAEEKIADAEERDAERATNYVDSFCRETIVCHLEDGTSIQGVLSAVHRDCIVLIHAKVLGADHSTPVDGEAVIERSRRFWLQRLAPPAEA